MVQEWDDDDRSLKNFKFYKNTDEKFYMEYESVFSEIKDLHREAKEKLVTYTLEEHQKTVAKKLVPLLPTPSAQISQISQSSQKHVTVKKELQENNEPVIEAEAEAEAEEEAEEVNETIFDNQIYKKFAYL